MSVHSLVLKTNSIVSRCSQYSGFRLGWSMKGGLLRIEDPARRGDSTLTLALDGDFLHEVYGRMWHWGITVEEQITLRQLLQQDEKEVLEAQANESYRLAYTCALGNTNSEQLARAAGEDAYQQVMVG